MVIGIHKGGYKKKAFNVGIFIGQIIEELNRGEEIVNKINIINNNNFIVNNIERNKYFFTLEEYNNEIYKYHHMISKFYVEQTENMYSKQYFDLNDYLLNSNIQLEKSRDEIMHSLVDFKDLQVNYQNIVRSNFINDINILMENNFDLTMEKFGYFIAGFMKALDLFGKNKEAHLIVESELEKKKVQMDYDDLLKFKNNINKIISFKNFLNEIAPTSHLHGLIYKFANNISSSMSEFKMYLLGRKNFSVSLKIKYNHKDKKWIPNCFSVSTSAFPEKIFQFFTFFIIKNVIINEEKETGEIELESIGRKEILEEKMCNDLEKNYIIYNSNENIFEFEK